MYGIEKYRTQNWYVTRVSGRMSAQFAIKYVLYPAAGVRRHKFEMEQGTVLSMVHRLHKMWFQRTKDLIVNRFWHPGGINTRAASLLTFRRVMHCRPSCLFFDGGNKGKLRPCRRDRFCPWCWARTASFGYRLYKRDIRVARMSHDNLALTCRVIAHKIPADAFHSASGYSPEQASARASAIQAVLEQHREAYGRLTKQLQRKTLGSAWRLVVNPCDDGWVVEARQLFLASARKSLPLVEYPGAKTVTRVSTCVHDDDAVFETLGRFFEYPAGLMTSYAELAAVYLQASSSMRTCSGTGVFRATGQGLLQHIKKETAHGACSSKARLDDFEEPDSCEADVFM